MNYYGLHNKRGSSSIQIPTAISTITESVTNSLYRNTPHRTRDNVYLSSPVNILMALMYLVNGARGGTLSELLDYLQIDSSNIDQLTSDMAQLINSVRKIRSLSVYNCCLIDYSVPIVSSYRQSVTRLGDLLDVDFARNSRGVIDNINSIVERETRGMITNIANESLVPPITKMIALSVLYLNIEWENKFKKYNVSKKRFMTLDREEKDVYMMYQESHVDCYKGDDHKMIKMPCKDNFSVVFILPTTDNNSALDRDLVPSSYMPKMNNQEVEISIPKFRVESYFSVKETLERSGVASMFNDDMSSPDASDMSGVNGKKRDLYVSDIIHKVVLEMSESGVEASSVTMSTMLAMAAMPVEKFVFKANRTFRYQILYNDELVLFDGIYDGHGESYYNSREDPDIPEPEHTDWLLDDSTYRYPPIDDGPDESVSTYQRTHNTIIMIAFTIMLACMLYIFVIKYVC